MFSDFPAWWNALQTIEKVYWLIAFPATLLFFIQLVITFIGGDVEHDFDHSFDSDMGGDMGSDGLHPFTFKNMVAFFTLFSWSGLASIEGGFSLIITLLISTISGLLMMFIMAFLFYYISKFAHSGTLDMNNAIGLKGDVYLTIPAKKAGMGKVQITVQGQLRTLNAITEDIEDIKTGAVIEVDEIVNGNILVVHKAR